MGTLPKDEVLRDAGTSACVLGNVAIARGALEAGVGFFSCYPGTPSSEIADTLCRVAGETGIRFEYSINEKAAIETSFAASLTGARSMCSMKHVGLFAAMDPAANIPYVGVQGGMVIVSAGDPSMLTSSNECDQRHLTRMLFYPVFDPATPADALAMTRYAFGFSEDTRLPVLVRPTARICHASGMMRFGPLPRKRAGLKFVKDPARHVPIPVNARRMRRELSERYALAGKLFLESPFFPREGKGPKGIIAGGMAYAYVRQALADLDIHGDVTLQQVGAYPIPADILEGFLSMVESVLVVEELTPFIEDWLTLAAYRGGQRIPILGKHSGHFPQEFEYSPEIVEDGIRRFMGRPPRAYAQEAVACAQLPPRPPVLCAGCPHRASYYLARKIFGKSTVYVNDIGCYTLGYGEPLDSCDVLLCMGSGITQASGIARSTGRRTVAYIGDSTFFHSGLTGLANALRMGDDITVIILNNYVTAMTGFQPSPASPDERCFSIEATVRGLGVKEVYSADPFDQEAALSALRHAKAGSGVNVIIFNSPCVVHESRSKSFVPGEPYEIDQQACTQCTLCVRFLGCPALSVVDGHYRIERALCTGCALCAGVCKKRAICKTAAASS